MTEEVSEGEGVFLVRRECRRGCLPHPKNLEVSCEEGDGLNLVSVKISEKVLG